MGEGIIIGVQFDTSDVLTPLTGEQLDLPSTCTYLDDVDYIAAVVGARLPRCTPLIWTACIFPFFKKIQWETCNWGCVYQNQ